MISKYKIYKKNPSLLLSMKERKPETLKLCSWCMYPGGKVTTGMETSGLS